MIDLSVWKKKIVIVPFKGAGPILFGMSKEQLVKIAGEPGNVSKTAVSPDGVPLETFYVEDSGNALVWFRVGYRLSLKVQFIEFLKCPKLVFHGLSVLSPDTTNQQVGDLIRRLDPEVHHKMYEGGAVHDYRSYKFGIDFFSDSGEPDEPIDTVQIFDESFLGSGARREEVRRIVDSILGGQHDA